jgi:hypothetical protein
MRFNILVPASFRMLVIELYFQSCSGRVLGMTLNSKAWNTLRHFIEVNQWNSIELAFNW